MRGGGVRWLYLPEHWRGRTAEEGCVMYIECENRTQMLYHILNACAHTLAFFFTLKTRSAKDFVGTQKAQSIHNASLLPVYDKKIPHGAGHSLAMEMANNGMEPSRASLKKGKNTAEHLMRADTWSTVARAPYPEEHTKAKVVESIRFTTMRSSGEMVQQPGPAGPRSGRGT